MNAAPHGGGGDGLERVRIFAEEVGDHPVSGIHDQRGERVAAAPGAEDDGEEVAK